MDITVSKSADNSIALTLQRDSAITPVRYNSTMKQLVSYQGRALVQLGPKGQARLEAAMVEAQPAVWEEAYGAQATGAGWEYVGVVNDALGLYRRLVSPRVTINVTV